MTDVDVASALYAIESAIHGRQQTTKSLPAPETHHNDDWPPDYDLIHAWRQQQLAKFEQDDFYLDCAIAHYSKMEARSCIDFINHWCDTYDPRNVGHDKPVRMPFILFERQAHIIDFLVACLMGNGNGLIEKSRDMGATWVCISFSTWLWLFHPGVAIGWGSNKAEQVDKLGEPDTIFEKFRKQIQMVPEYFRPPVLEGVHLKFNICHNPENGAVIRGQVGKNIGRGGRSRIYFVDEAAHLDNSMAVEASLSENTRCRIDLSSVSGVGTLFHRKREAGRVWVHGAEISQDVTNVFILDWTEHPEKTVEWYARQRRRYESQGTPEILAREIDRDYMAAAQGIIIPYEYVKAAIDAHKKLGFDDSGGKWGGLDIADSGPDANALVQGRGLVVKHASEWGERDPGATARRAFRLCRDTMSGGGSLKLQYDCIGMGTNVKSEFNRLSKDEGIDVSWLKVVPWDAGRGVVNPGEPVIQKDDKSPRNKDFFANFKAQAWWNLGQRFYKTWRAVQALDSGEEVSELEYDFDELISIDSSTIDQKTLGKLMKELSQATMGQDGRLKLRVNKAPDGAKSPNLADALIMGRFPSPDKSMGRVSRFGPKVFTL